MKAIHCLQNYIIEKETDKDLGFLLSNNAGGYLCLSEHPLSRYQGWFCAEENKLFRVIENIQILNGPPIDELINNFWNIERKRSQITESFFLPLGKNSLIYEVSEPSEIELCLDIKESYDNREWGRDYQVFDEGETIMVKYNQENKSEIYLAIKSDGAQYEKIDQWFVRHYQLDKDRDSPPFKRYVYRALKLKGQKIFFALSQDKTKAFKEVHEISEQLEKLKITAQERIKGLILPEKIKDPEIKLSYFCAQNSLDSLIVQNEQGLGLYAGLPWFFQFWSEDEAISLKSVINSRPHLAKKILLRSARSISQNGTTPNIFGTNSNEPSRSSYASGWVFDRIDKLTSQDLLSKKESEEIKKHLKKAINGLLQYYTEDDLAINGPFDTWMDSQDRSGARIEHQALRLNLYRLAYDLTKDIKYLKLEKQLRKKVREKFWNGEFLADGLNDLIIRPNIFLAAYLYPKLLKKEEWIRCFENSLAKLWLEWGGLATIDKTNPLFCEQDSGENSRSYHNGDSWFYLNNLTALVLYRFDKTKFQSYINKILEASEEEILWQGVVGHHSELSSAAEFKSQGSWIQAWSDAFYLEAIEEMMGS